MSADSAITYTFVHSEARSWSIPSEDPYEEAARQLLEQAPHSPEYVPEDHVPVYIPEPEHPEDLVPAEDEAPTPLLPPFLFYHPTIYLLEVTYQVDVSTRCYRLVSRAKVIENQTRQDLARSEAHCRALEARVTVLETDARRHEWQRQAADDLTVQYIMRTQVLEAGARVDTLEDTGSSS
ncbi:hypothetical protein Tco_1244451 [Tanacetum coccineum]